MKVSIRKAWAKDSTTKIDGFGSSFSLPCDYVITKSWSDALRGRRLILVCHFFRHGR